MCLKRKAESGKRDVQASDQDFLSCFVRSRRLNVIIQPHLRFVYELMKWDEHLQTRRDRPIRRSMEWQTVCREIATMNKPYSRC